MGEKSLAKARARVREDAIEIEPENGRAVRLFLALATQWRWQPRSNGKVELLARTGIDYAVMPGICAALCITLDEELLAQLRILESETLEIHASRDAKTFASAK